MPFDPGSRTERMTATLGDSEQIDRLLRELSAIREQMVADSTASGAVLETVDPAYRASARNLLDYLTLRRRDLRPLQLRLAEFGLSSLGRAEACVLASVDAVLAVLHRLAEPSWTPPAPATSSVDFSTGQRLLAEHTERLLGPAPAGRDVRIMVTMPTAAAHDYLLLHDLLAQGMNCMRINCAHDNVAVWSRMIENLRRAEEALGRRCKIVMDLAGPKLRTGPVSPGPAVVHIRPARDEFGRVTEPARVWLCAASPARPPPTPADACLSLPADWLGRLGPGDRLHFTDARGAARAFVVVDSGEDGCWAEASKSAYVVPGTVLRCEGAGPAAADAADEPIEAVVGPLAPISGVLVLHAGDRLVLTRNLRPGRPASRDARGTVLRPASIGCTIPQVLDCVRTGEAIWFDEGKLGGVIDSVEPDRVVVRITQAPVAGAKLGGDKGINLPESALRLDALTPKDIEDLRFAAQHADIIELSFANTARDVEHLQEHLMRLGGRPPAIVLKIETRRGFQNLPEMLLAAMRWPSCGVMIARGDLAVECGFERLAEVQEEILWICEAAHLPVIWATQVLETLAKRGLPSRAEITDAAMSHRAECVMLNKGPYVLSAVKALDDILRRMQGHETKKRSLLRELRLAHAFGQHAAQH